MYDIETMKISNPLAGIWVFIDESFKLRARGHMKTGGDDTATNVPFALLYTPPNFMHGKQDFDGQPMSFKIL